jgi:hypothetical protein
VFRAIARDPGTVALIKTLHFASHWLGLENLRVLTANAGTLRVELTPWTVCTGAVAAVQTRTVTGSCA